MVTGIIDVGSNTVRLSIYRLENGGSFKLLLSKKIVAGLASYVTDGALGQEGIEKLYKCLKEFRSIVTSLEVSAVRAFATASLRYVRNAKAVVSSMYNETGLLLEIINGEEEAHLSFMGARYSTGIENGVVVDLGGASCELIREENGIAVGLTSIPLGCLSLSVGNVDTIFPEPEATENMKAVIKNTMKPAIPLLAKRPETLCFVGGTARGASRSFKELHLRANGSFGPEGIDTLIKGFELRDTATMQAVRSAAPDRVFTLYAGLLIMREIIQASSADSLLVSKCGIREGYLIDRIIGA
ncbi:MAG: hypothetical protein LBC35_03075 [Coriobacteriales bacterium]|jgi:exopolyphosphatase/guanosine-5'-triphosphate,3'-diphosphate pyrophosphatase|nr:hypothetical protein [Coriobacteriales bacterium]